MRKLFHLRANKSSNRFKWIMRLIGRMSKKVKLQP